MKLEEKKKKPYSSVTYTTGDPKLNIDHFNKMLMGKEENTHTDGYLNGTFKHDNKAAEQAAAKVGTFASQSPDGASSISTGAASSGSGDAGGSAGGVGESLVKDGNELEEAKRYVRRYYMRPQDIFCSNKDEVLKALIEHENEDSVIYTLNNLGDNKDVHKLNDNDIIYYYEDGILYDKNHVRIMDYDLSIKHEEEREKINPNTVSDKTFADVYDDRMTELTQLDEEANLVEAAVWYNQDKQREFNQKWADRLNTNPKQNPRWNFIGTTITRSTKNGNRYENPKDYTIERFYVGGNNNDLMIRVVSTKGIGISFKARDVANKATYTVETANGSKFCRIEDADEFLISQLKTWLEEEKIETRRNSGDKLISDLSEEEKDFAKEYFSTHIESIKYTLKCGDEAVLSTGEVLDRKKFKSAADTFDRVQRDFEKEFGLPVIEDGEKGNLGYHITYEYEPVTNKHELNLERYTIGCKNCVIKFTEHYNDMPELIKSIISGEKKNKDNLEQSNVTDVEQHKDPNPKTISSVPLGKAIMELFDYDTNFLAKSANFNELKPAINADDAFNLDFESINVPDFSDLQEALDASFDTHSLDEFIGKHCIVTLGSKVLDGTIKSFTKDDENRVIITVDSNGKSFEVVLETVVDLDNIKLDDETETANLKDIIIAAKLPEEEVVIEDPKVLARKEAEKGKVDGKAAATEQFGTERGKANFNKYKDEYTSHQLDKRNYYQYYYKLLFLQTYQGLKNEAKAKKAAEKAAKAKHEEFCLDFDSLAEDVSDNKCVICGEEIRGYGNNAEPYTHGRCCDACKLKFVLPARIEALRRGE